MEKDYIEEEEDDEDEDEAETSGVSSDTGLVVEMVGVSGLFDTVQDLLISRMRPDDRYILSLFAEHGSGRTVVARAVFEDLRGLFDCCALVTVGAGCGPREVLLSVIAQVDAPPADVRELLVSAEDEILCRYLHLALENQRYMIVLDDVDDAELGDRLITTSFPDQSNGSMVILTTRVKEVALLADQIDGHEEIPAYFEQRVWFILREALFGTRSISPELEEAGKKIVENCRGRMISTAKTFLFLMKLDKTEERWREIAENKNHPSFMLADEISEISQIEIEMQNYDNRIVEMISPWIDFSPAVEDVKMKLHPESYFSKLQIISFVGMAGIGKSAFARKIFNDESISSNFNCHVWITLGQKYQPNEILLDILTRIFLGIDELHTMKIDDILVRGLCDQVSHKRCLIVLDDLCSQEPLHNLKNLFPDIKGTILVTTRLVKVAKFGRDDTEFRMKLLDKEDSWCLLRQKVFDEGLCPPELENVGRQIAERCDGLPLLILTVAEQLREAKMSEEYWNNVASGKQKSVFKNAHDQISKALLPSYHSLPQHLKTFFLYMGAFRERYEITRSSLTHMLISEGFLKPTLTQTKEYFVEKGLFELANASLIMVHFNFWNHNIKICRFHYVFWHLSTNQAIKNGFFYAIDSYDDCLINSLESQQRLCIRNNILLGMKDVQNLLSSSTNAHSLLCVGPFLRYPVPLVFYFRLLRVMNATTIRLYEFPVVRPVHLRYLGLTCNGELPTSISNLRKLQYLIVKRYMNIKNQLRIRGHCRWKSGIWRN